MLTITLPNKDKKNMLYKQKKVAYAPPNAQFAVRQGYLLANNIKNYLNNGTLKEFQYSSKGSLASLGSKDGVGKIYFITVKGFIAWLIWRAFYLSFLPSYATKIRVFFGWVVEYLVPRNAVMTRALKNDAVSYQNFKKGDIEAIVDDSFNVAFPKIDGLGLNPWVEGSMLVCPGARIDKSQTKHICKFVAVGDDWSWESSNMISDVIRRDQSSKKFRQHSITLISPYEGMTVDVIMQKSQNGKHLVDSVDSYIFSNGSLKKTMSNSSRSREH